MRHRDLSLFSILFFHPPRWHGKVRVIWTSILSLLLIRYNSRTKHVLQYLVILSVNTGVILWQVVMSHFHCTALTSRITSLATAVTLILVLRLHIYVP